MCFCLTLSIVLGEGVTRGKIELGIHDPTVTGPIVILRDADDSDDSLFSTRSIGKPRSKPQKVASKSSALG